MNQPIKLAIFGATSLIGQAVLKQLESSSVEIDTLYPVVTEIDEQQTSIRFNQGDVPLVEATDFDWQLAQAVLFVGLSEETKNWADTAVSAGCKVIDATGAELIGSVLAADLYNPTAYVSSAIVHCASATSLMLSRVLTHLQNDVGIESVDITSLKSADYYGKAGVDELAGQTARLLNGLPVEPEVFTGQIAFNLLSAFEAADEGANTFEQQVEAELPELLDDSSIRVFVQGVLVPLFFGECATVKIRTRLGLSRGELIDLFDSIQGVRLDLDEQVSLVSDLNGQELVSVSQLRQYPTDQQLLSFTVQADSYNGCLAPNLVELIELVTRY